MTTDGHAPAKPAPCGTWPSPVSTELIVSDMIGFCDVHMDGSTLYWVERRPSEEGRCVIMHQELGGQVHQLLDPPLGARSRVHEYGGGSFTARGGTVYFVDATDHRVYSLSSGPSSVSPPVSLTSPSGARYADLLLINEHSLILVVEDADGGGEVVNSLARLDTRATDQEPAVLAHGHDFYASPCISPDGSRLAWLTWDHPNMPWDGTELWTGEFDEAGNLQVVKKVAGAVDESIFQPQWSPDGTLHYVSDRSGWWNLYRTRDGSHESLCPMEAEFGLPQWVFGMSTYGFLSASKILCARSSDGHWILGVLDTDSAIMADLDLPWTDFSTVRTGADGAAFIAGSPTSPASLIRLDPCSGATDTVRASCSAAVDPEYLSTPRPIEFPTAGGRTAHAFHYPPANLTCRVPENASPPLIVCSHGGPTGATSSVLDMRIQYWTSRGFAVVDVNYGGSTGYGREYRQRLDGTWGVTDVDDCIHAARYLVDEGHADAARLTIRGGSAGGYTTLAALTFHDVFAAGASHYGVSDLQALTEDTHKFESRYLDRLIGPWPECRELYHERSPIHHTDRLSCPLIILQGLEDKVVPPSQALMMRDALRNKGLPVACVMFENEQHGFRRSENIRRALEAELYFYGRVFGFAPADDLEPVEIDNLQ